MKTQRHLLLSRVSIHHVVLFASLIFFSVPGSFSSRAVTLRSIQIYNTHEFLGPHPTIYFFCVGENKTILPDVKEKHFFYNFKGEESWQNVYFCIALLASFLGLLYMINHKNGHDYGRKTEPKNMFRRIFSALSIFTYLFKVIILSIKFSSGGGSANRKIGVALVVIISVLASMMATMVTVAAYKYWQKRKRERDQARFLKLFEKGDDIEDELNVM